MNTLPNIEKMRIPTEKFTHYALDFAKDKAKATAFQKALGYNETNAEELIASIAASVEKFEAVPKGDDGYGMCYEVIMPLKGANGKTANVLTAWIDDARADELRLISAYVTKRKVVSNKNDTRI